MEAASTNPTRYVYFMCRARDGAIKIGVSWDPAERADSLSAPSYGNGKVTLLGCMIGDRATEAELHERFADSRMEGEWFTNTPELAETIAAATAQHPPHRRRRSPPRLPQDRSYRMQVQALGHVLTAAIRAEDWDLVVALTRGARAKRGVSETRLRPRPPSPRWHVQPYAALVAACAAQDGGAQ